MITRRTDQKTRKNIKLLSVTNANIPDRKILYMFKPLTTDRLLTKFRVITILTHEKRVPKITNDGIITNTDAVFLLKE